MVNPAMLYNKIISRPPDVSEEVNDFVDFVLQKKQRTGNANQNAEMENTDKILKSYLKLALGV